MIGRHVSDPGFRWFVERPWATDRAHWEARPDLIEAVPVGLLPSAAAAGMSAGSPVVRLTERVMHKQQVNHPGFTAALYGRLPEILAGTTPRRGERVATGQRWEFDWVMDATRPRRVLRVVVEVPDVDRRPLIISVHKHTRP